MVLITVIIACDALAAKGYGDIRGLPLAEGLSACDSMNTKV